jgi:hypothetical protein
MLRAATQIVVHVPASIPQARLPEAFQTHRRPGGIRFLRFGLAHGHLSCVEAIGGTDLMCRPHTE